MKQILITGKRSYIGESFKLFMREYSELYSVIELDTTDDSWKVADFSTYDIIFHVAGIAHSKEKNIGREKYIKINCDLAYEIAKKAKNEGVKNFIFMSSMSIYGLDFSNNSINQDTIVRPTTYYGESKYEAEKRIVSLINNEFTVSILRPPMVYGVNSPGNMSKLLRMIDKIPIFPNIENKRSAISIDCLTSFVLSILENKKSMIYFPQNNEYFCTSEEVRKYSRENHRKILFISFFNPIIKFSIGKVKLISKIFGNLYYDLNFKEMKISEDVYKIKKRSND